MTLYLHGVGHFHPKNEIDNRFLESLDIGTDDQWIMERVGIRSRRTALSLDYIRETRNANPAAAIEASEHSLAWMGARAAEMALERAGVDKSDIGMVVGGGCSPDTASPAEACNIARELELEVPSFDVNSACTSFFTGMKVLSMMQPSELPPYFLLTTAEGMTRTVHYDDRSSAVLWGDGSLSMVLSATVPSPVQIVGNTIYSSPAGATKVVVPRLGHFAQDGRTVQMFAIRKSAMLLKDLQAKYTEPGRDFHFIGHQANLRMLESVCKRCDIPEENHHFNVDWYGNTGASSAPSVVSMNWEKWKPDDDLALVGVGSGLTWSSYMIRFGQEVD